MWRHCPLSCSATVNTPWASFSPMDDWLFYDQMRWCLLNTKCYVFVKHEVNKKWSRNRSQLMEIPHQDLLSLGLDFSDYIKVTVLGLLVDHIFSSSIVPLFSYSTIYHSWCIWRPSPELGQFFRLSNCDSNKFLFITNYLASGVLWRQQKTA